MPTRTPVLSPEAIAAALGQFPPTPEQAAVIAAPLAPALVVAGAGSGKTETMSGRVVWLVANGLVRRDEILGLTFTRKAAGELAERIQRRLDRLTEFESRGLLPDLEDLYRRGELEVFGRIERESGDPRRAAALRRATLDRLSVDKLARDAGAGVSASPPGAGADDARADALLERPTVATYNSFADQLVRENAVRIGRDPESVVLSESAAWLLMRRVVQNSDDPGLEEIDRRPSTIIDAALRFARDAVDNLADPDAVAAFAEGLREVLDRPSERGAGPLAPVRDAVAPVSWLPQLATLARAYDAEKRRRGLIDFSDQVAGALEVVRSHPSIAEELRVRYRVVLLDEYQDTSVVQSDLLATIFAGTAVMAVGDPHQSIYGWRGASAGNLGAFARAFARRDGNGADALRFSLLTSWRNSEQVLAAANAVLAPLANRTPVAVGALGARPHAPEGLVEVAYDGDVDAEAERVAQWFADLRAARAVPSPSTQSTRTPSPPMTGAILFRAKKHMLRFAEALGRRGIPHRILGLGGLLSTPEVVDVVATIRVLSDPRSGSALIRLLEGPRWAVGLPDLRALAALARRLGRSDTSLQALDADVVARLRRSGDESASLIDALDFIGRQSDDHGWLADITPSGRARLRDAAATFAALRRAAGLPIPELVRLIDTELRLDVELAANEARGPARVAGDQLRAFVDELQGFLATDDSGSLPALLAWLDRAERADEFAPRTEPPEDDVVQLLTIHGSKGLEWDAVAVVRAVHEELPAKPRDGLGWLRFGVLPYPFRGDRDWLPRLAWGAEDAPTQQALRSALEDFSAALKDRQLEEERRLAYVAVTRARDRLLVTGSAWSGTKTPRRPSPFLAEIAAAVGAELDVPVDAGDNPYLDARRLLSWPLDPLGARRAAVSAAAARVRAAQAATPASASREVTLLLAERAERDRRGAASRHGAPTRLAASRYKDFVADYDGAVAALALPLPERPYRQTRLGTLFHAWVERRAGLPGAGDTPDAALWEQDEDDGDSGAGTVGPGDAAALAALQERFLASEWAPLQPIEVEVEIDVVLDDLLPDGRPHIAICKLDAVYRRGDRIEIVDWKTGRAPRTAAERDERLLQLRLYRRAYHARSGIPESDIDVALFYVADDLIIRD
ncbi:MAG: ATP-dependent helicase [Microbacterium sp.]|nr:ATP-dependent helicase [Microbacterium sp.]